MKVRVTIVDYGLGNLHSVQKAFESLGCAVVITDEADMIEQAERVILPGVGAFPDGMKGLQSRGLDKVLSNYVASGRPLLGICLGAQLLFEEGEEFGLHPGLGLVPGRVVRIPAEAVRVPHVGWARLQPPLEEASFGGVLSAVPPGSWMYFIHSYQMVPSHSEHLAAVCQYGPNRINAAIHKGGISGVQFHPEKSGQMGMRILSTFAATR